jgi:hypothetical protein
MRRLGVGLVLLLGWWHSVFARNYQEVPELAAIFQKQGSNRTFVLLDDSSDTLFVSNKPRDSGSD